jgi:putative oxidoreductase
MFLKILQTENDPILVLLRLVLGAIFFAHGAQKMLGWFGGYGFFSTMAVLTQKMGIPAVFAFLAIAAEFFGSIGLLAGLLSRIAAFGIAVNMVVAIALVNAHNGFFINWNGAQAGEGFEFHLLVLAIAVTIMVRGGGFFSVDHVLYWLFEPVSEEGTQSARDRDSSSSRAA